MKTVGRLGSYITKGVCTVSGSLHPFGGAVDIIVVEQPDGSFKSSPWYVRFGKFQGVLKAKDKVVRIGVNGVEANFHMYLDPRGEAYFLREVEEGEPVLSPLSYIGETDSGPLKALRPVKSEGSISDSCLSNSGDLDDGRDGKIVVRSTSRRSKIMGIVFGRRSAPTKDDGLQEVDGGTGIPRMGSLERAEIAENLLELQWFKSKKGSRLPPFPAPYRVDGNPQVNSSVSASSTKQTQSSVLAEDVVETSGDKFPTVSSGSNKTSLPKADDYGSRDISGAINHEAQRLGSGELCEGDGLEERHTWEMDIAPSGSGIPGQDNGSNKVISFIHWETSPGLEFELDGLKERRHETLFFSGAEQEEVIAYSQSDIVSSAPVSECSEEEHLLFGDLDEFRTRRVLNGLESPNILYIESSGGVNEPYIELVSPPEEIVKNNELGLETKLASSPVNIREIHNVLGSEAGGLAESMPDISFHIDSLDTGLLKSSSYSLDLSSKPMEWTLCQDDSGSSHVNSGSVNQAVGEHSGGKDLGNDGGVAVASAIGDPSKEIATSGGSRRVSPLYQKQLGSRRTSYSALNDTGSLESVNASDTAGVKNLSSLENDSSSSIGMNAVNDTLKQKIAKMMARVITPTSEQLASLNLQEGKNIVTFTFSTPMLGNQEVDARIFLWKWNTRVVISDVDGTITKSDVLGQFMPLVGVDWSQTGVANLFCAIKENGYQLLFLSARAISQAYHTRRFLCSLTQDGKTLPEGPVVISPDGLFPSLFREVIRRAPHEFKIACLEDIKALFPPDCQPFYAGFGNRDTDEISYVKVGIPKGKIFIINPKGEVSVHRRVDRKSYHSLHDLVHGMFPSTVTIEQEDFNSWNYWKLPSPFLDV